MALNPIVYTEKVVRSFLRYQLTAYPFADERLHARMRQLLSLDQTRQSPLLNGPYVSLSRSFRQGAAVDELIAEGIIHPHIRQRIPAAITHLYRHQGDAIRAIHKARTPLVSTGTGQGNQADAAMHFGLGDHSAEVTLEILWPGNRRQSVKTPVDRVVTVKFAGK